MVWEVLTSGTSALISSSLTVNKMNRSRISAVKWHWTAAPPERLSLRSTRGESDDWPGVVNPSLILVFLEPGMTVNLLKFVFRRGLSKTDYEKKKRKSTLTPIWLAYRNVLHDEGILEEEEHYFCTTLKSVYWIVVELQGAYSERGVNPWLIPMPYYIYWTELNSPAYIETRFIHIFNSNLNTSFTQNPLRTEWASNHFSPLPLVSPLVSLLLHSSVRLIILVYPSSEANAISGQSLKSYSIQEVCGKQVNNRLSNSTWMFRPEFGLALCCIYNPTETRKEKDSA